MRDFLAAESLMTDREVKLSAGGAANFYFDCKRATLNGAFLNGLADWILDSVAPRLDPPAGAVGGPTMGADFIAAAVVARAHRRGLDLTHGCIARAATKTYGAQNRIENNPRAPTAILVVEDVITTGASIAAACDAFLDAGHSIAAIAAIIDREAGGKQSLQDQYGAPVIALFNRGDFPEANASAQ